MSSLNKGSASLNIIRSEKHPPIALFVYTGNKSDKRDVLINTHPITNSYTYVIKGEILVSKNNFSKIFKAGEEIKYPSNGTYHHEGMTDDFEVICAVNTLSPTSIKYVSNEITTNSMITKSELAVLIGKGKVGNEEVNGYKIMIAKENTPVVGKNLRLIRIIY